MPKNAKIQDESKDETQEEIQEEAQEQVRVDDPLQPQDTDTPAKSEYRAMLARYKEQNPVKYERKKEEFLKKLAGMITVQVARNPKGIIRKTFSVPNIQSKRK